MSARQRFSQAAVIAAFQRYHGMTSLAARHLNCSRSTIDRYVLRYPRVAEAKREEREATVDIAELALMKAVQAGEGWAIMLLLKTLGKSRGYTERTEIIEYTDDVGFLSDDERAERASALIGVARARLAGHLDELAARRAAQDESGAS